MARRQHGYVTRRQLLGLGCSASMINRMLAAGSLIRVYVGVYAVGHEPRGPLAQSHAAVLASGAHAVLGRRSALSLLGVKRDWLQPFEVLVPSGHERKGIVAHRVTTLAPRDVALRAGIPCTTITRTVFDVIHTDRRPPQLLREARNRARLHLPALGELMSRLPHHPSVPVLRALITGDLGPTRSELEDRFVWLVRTYGLPEPRLNVPMSGRVVDAFFPSQRLIVELDSFAWHADSERFESDRDRDVDHLVLGLATARITWERMQTKPAREAGRLQHILEQRTEDCC
jgi:very-short-patch-repair endonuclease